LAAQPTSSDTVTCDPEGLRALVASIFSACGSNAEEAGEIAWRLTLANLTGHDSHGVVQVPRYVAGVRAGEVAVNRTPEVIAEGGPWLHLDASFGFGQRAGAIAMRAGISRARQHGVGLIALKASGHLGRIGDWAEMAADAGMVSLHLVNVTGCVWVAPFGGTQPRLSTNPIAAGVPRANGEHVILDMATSVVAEGKLQVAAQSGRTMGRPVAVRPDGSETEDPLAIYGGRLADQPALSPESPGAMLAFGGHKGSGLALICELLAGAMTGTGCAQPEPEAPANGMLSILIDPTATGMQAGMAAEVERYLDFFTSSAPKDPGHPVTVPGAPERAIRRARERDGIPLPQATWDGLARVSRELNLPVERVTSARRTA
jgi:uncharacterized oxidoreductase